MSAIIQGTERLVPMYSSDVVTRNAPAPIVQFDFWAVINKLAWVDADDNQPAVNPTAPSQKITYAEWQHAQLEAAVHYNALYQYLTTQDFWNMYAIADGDRPKLVWHIIGRGEQVYKAVRGDATFAVGYIAQPCGFMELMAQWR